MFARDLVSKILAAGLSAGLFLIWWPEHHPTTDLGSLVVRGALWTLCFELLLLAFAPLERLVTRAVRVRVSVKRPEVPTPARVGGACMLACAGAALPLVLLAGSHAPRPAPAPKPRKVVVVKHLRQKVIVREVVRVPSAAVEHPAPPPAVVVRAAPKKAATKKPAKQPKPVARRAT